MYDQDKVRQRLVVIRVLILPALIEELIQFVPSLELEHRLQFQFDHLEVLRNDVSLGRSAELVYSLGYSVSELPTVLSGFDIVLSLFRSVYAAMPTMHPAHTLFNAIFGTRQGDIGACGEKVADHES